MPSGRGYVLSIHNMMIIFHRCRGWGIPWAKILRIGENGFLFFGVKISDMSGPHHFQFAPDAYDIKPGSLPKQWRD